MPMNAVADILDHDGMPPAAPSADNEDNQPAAWRGIPLGVKLIFLSILIAPIFLGISFSADSPVPLFVPLTVFLAGSLWLVYSRMFGEGPSPENTRGGATQVNLTNARRPALSSPQSVSGLDTRAADTGEVLPPPSVTDHTTRLLD
jgi:hypothetical protein